MLRHFLSLFSGRREPQIFPSIIDGNLALNELVEAWHHISETKKKSPQEQEDARNRFYSAYQGAALVFGVTDMINDPVTTQQLSELSLDQWKQKTNKSDDNFRSFFSAELTSLSTLSRAAKSSCNMR